MLLRINEPQLVCFCCEEVRRHFTPVNKISYFPVWPQIRYRAAQFVLRQLLTAGLLELVRLGCGGVLEGEFNEVTLVDTHYDGGPIQSGSLRVD